MKEKLRCKECGEEKPKYCKGLCHECCNKIYQKEFHKNNPEYHHMNSKKHDKNNPGYHSKNGIVFREKNPGYMRNWLKNNPNYYKNMYNNNTNFRISNIIRSRIYTALKRGYDKSGSSEELLGCNIKHFIKYIKKLMLPEMNWETHGIEWEIDHINIINTFDLSKPEEQHKCFHYTNQRPLWKTTDIANKYGYDNIIGNRNRVKK